ncbi:MAG: AI-2E family transporter [Patescibacteria group bacterium]|nr:AI-2E family transporter [Patescibacteria group bacterium]
MKKQTIVISPSIVWHTLVILIGLFLLYYVRSIALLVYLAFILATALSPMAVKLQKRAKLNRPTSVILSFLIFLTLVVIILSLLIPPLAKQLVQLVKLIDLPIFQDQIKSFDFSIQEFSTLASGLGTSVGVIFQIILSAFNGIFSFVALLILSYYMTMEKPILHHKAYWFTKNEAHIQKIDRFMKDLDVQLGGWVRGEAILMLVIAGLTYLGLTLLSIPYALPLALLAGLMEIIPNLGPTISAIPSIFIAYITFGPAMAGVVFLMGIIIQQLENSVIVPRVMQTNAHVSPLITIVGILVGFQLAGVTGALLSIPTYITFRTIYATFFRDRVQHLSQ